MADVNTGGRRRTGWILVSVAALIAAVFITASAIRGRGPSTGIPGVTQSPTAREAYSLVEAWAPQWLADAVVVRLTTTHQPQGDSEGGWTFQVYSPSRKALAAVRVQGQEVSILRETAALYAQRALPEDAWTVDSSGALETWWVNGGQAAWERPGAEAVALRLGFNGDNQLTWQVTVSWTSSEQLGFWEIDAGSGEILSISEGGGSEN